MMQRYEFTQNNSWWSFDVNNNLCHRLFIQAKTEDKAIIKAESLWCYWDWVEEWIDCECCWDRRSNYYVSSYTFPYKNFWDKVIYKTIKEFAQMLANKYWFTKPDCKLYYNNWKVIDIFTQKNKK